MALPLWRPTKVRPPRIIYISLALTSLAVWICWRRFVPTRLPLPTVGAPRMVEAPPSTALDKSFTCPIDLSDGAIHVAAKLGRRACDCIIDTGWVGIAWCDAGDLHTHLTRGTTR